MKSYVHITLIATFALFYSILPVARAQTAALSFDGTDDFVSVPAASALIANSQQISMTCWVMLENPAIIWPDYDGILGFRNDANADFYIVQHGQGAIEARYRNGTNNTFTIVKTGIQSNVWQHFALVFDGLNLSLYHNGMLHESIGAYGTIVNSFVDFLIGKLDYFTTNFMLLGQLDEVSLWNRALTPAEVFCAYSGPLNPQSPGLMLYFNFDEGIPSGNNSSITTVTDASGHINGVLNQFALNGATSNFVAGISGSGGSTTSVTICQGGSYFFNGQNLTSPGTYNAVYTSSAGCDSVVTLNLSVTPVNTSVSQAGVLLQAIQAGAAYQWVNCNTGFSIIPGAINQSFTATANGMYAVIVTQNGCSDTSSCIPVTTVGLEEESGSSGIRISPNPACGYFTLELGNAEERAELMIFSLSGQLLRKHCTYTTHNRIDISELPDGFYHILVRSPDKLYRAKLLKQE